ncbi:hypothetical protein B0I35DRAFT_14266 [Stachybotrys elegans]|uniref:Secreted protein n=1 Tax=Stachybotrys elegans TaxID=80388 RepID=A0A8K0T1R6_9HYPO|nr:hypothetical protein B0I35DRAFT_14266 [Stachybotrys elegans]
MCCARALMLGACVQAVVVMQVGLECGDPKPALVSPSPPRVLVFSPVAANASKTGGGGAWASTWLSGTAGQWASRCTKTGTFGERNCLRNSAIAAT